MTNICRNVSRCNNISRVCSNVPSICEGKEGPRGPTGLQGSQGFVGWTGPGSTDGLQGWTGAAGVTEYDGFPVNASGSYENAFIQFDTDTNTWLIIPANNVRVGESAGSSNQSADAVAVGREAGLNYQGVGAIGIGKASGRGISASTFQGDNAIAIGYETAYVSQGESSIAIGTEAGLSQNGINSIAIGAGAVSDMQTGSTGNNSIGIGFDAGKRAVENNISIGHEAGKVWGFNPLSIGSIFIGHNADAFHASGDPVIFMNGTGTVPLVHPSTGGLFLTPVRSNINLGGSPLPANLPSGFGNVVYNPTSFEMAYQLP